MLSEACGLTGQTLSQESIEQVPVTAGHPQADKTASTEMSALAAVALDGSMSLLPQIGDSDEKLRQVGQVFFIQDWSTATNIELNGSCCLVVILLLVLLASAAPAAHPEAAAAEECLKAGDGTR